MREVMKKSIYSLGLENIVQQIYLESKNLTPFATAKQEILEAYLLDNKIANHLEWFMPQLLAYIAKHWRRRLVIEGGMVVDFDDKFPIRIPELMNAQEANEYIDDKCFAEGVKGEWFDYIAYQLCKLDRSLFFKVPKSERVHTPQYKSQWNTTVPLVMAAFKMFGDVDYSNWTLAAAKKTSHKALAQFIGSEIPLDLTPEDRLALRLEATRTSAKQERPQWSLNLIGKIKDYARTEDYRDDKLYLYSLIQTWVMHPSNWTEYTIVSGQNFSQFPQPIAEAQVFKTQVIEDEAAPWLL